jgi:hypothetical protein
MRTHPFFVRSSKLAEAVLKRILARRGSAAEGTKPGLELSSLLLTKSGRQLHNSVLLPKPDLFDIGAR